MRHNDPFRWQRIRGCVAMGLCLIAAMALPVQAASRAAPAGEPAAEPRQAVPEPAAPSQAITLYNRGVELFQVAQIQAEKGNPQGQKALLREAADVLRQAFKADPTLASAQSNRGFVFLTLNDYKQAIRAFHLALAVDPHHVNSLNGLATAYAMAGKLPQSLQTFDRLTTLDPANPQYFFNRGSVLQKARRPDEAQAAYRQALKLDPQDQRVLFNLATLLENQGDYDAASEYYQQAKAVDISNPVGLEAIHRLKAIASLKAQQRQQEAAAASASHTRKKRKKTRHSGTGEAAAETHGPG